VGYVLTCIGRPEPVVDWLSDWKNRQNVESWMLYNLVIMLQRQGCYDESREIIRHAVALRHGEDLYEQFCLWAAFEEALLGNAAQAEQHLVAFSAKNTKGHLRPLLVMTQILIRSSREPASGAGERSRMVRKELRVAFDKRHPSQSTRYVRAGYRRFLTVVSRDSASLWCWCWWFYRGQRWLWVPVLVVLIPVALFTPPLWFFLFIAVLRHAQRD
jgi:hypothetical protein